MMLQFELRLRGRFVNSFRSHDKVGVCGLLLSAALLVAFGCSTPPTAIFDPWPVNDTGYAIEPLPIVAAATFVRRKDVYLAEASGDISKANDDDLSQPWTPLGRPFDAGPRLVFASSSGVVFASAEGKGLYRLADPAGQWQMVLDVPCWRMDEDDQGNLFVGNYTKDAQHVCTLYKSSDGGLTWSIAFRDEANNHIHTVRWDARTKSIYIAFGDSPTRGQAVSFDRGATFQTLERGPRQGHTDVAFTRDFVIWASDDQSGRVFRDRVHTTQTDTRLGGSEFMWFAIGGDAQLYVGTVPSRRGGGERAALLASRDQGQTWTKLMQSDLSTAPYSEAFAADSRQMSENGWIYFTMLQPPVDRSASYRVRALPE